MDINNLSKSELKEYAESVGVKTLANDTVDELKAKIAAANGTPVVPTGEEQVEAVKQAPGDGEKEVTVIFNTGENGDNSNVFFSINGKAMSLPRNQEVKVKKKYLDMLSKECNGFAVKQEVNRQTGQVETRRINKPIYTFQIVSN